MQPSEPGEFMADPEWRGAEGVEDTQRWQRIPDLVPVPPVRGAVAAEDARTALAAPRRTPEWLFDAEPAAGHGDEARAEHEYESTRERVREPVWRVLTRGFGELMVTVGLVLLLFVVYEVHVTDLLNDRRQDQLTEEIRDVWADAPEPTAVVPVLVEPAVGEPLAVLHIPRLGEDYQQVVLQGTDEAQLSQGPGHYAGTAMPGQPGNLAMAGHRVGKGSPFMDLDQLRPGDPIVVETADAWFVYRVLGDPATGDFATDPSGIPGQRIVRPSDVDVIAPTPGTAGAAPSGTYLTLTTCHPKYSARQRLIVHAGLDGAPVAKVDAPDGPPALLEVGEDS